MQIEYLISAAIGFAVAMIFIILPSWYRLIKYQFQKYIENISLIILIFFGIKKNVKKYFLNKFVKYSHIYTINSLL